MIVAKRFRCAVYTRKSTEEGLEQDFNSLAAQRAACEAYIASQAGEGWRLVKTAFDDGGFSGGNMERPALKALLAAIEAGEIDVIVVYKVDRLTRSLMDFARIVERLDAKGASFVSVTQAFNTTTSMGRLTLNVLLSFAQFEREITSERIRDKIALSKKRGLWMGGRAPLGYEGRDGVLQIVDDEAEIVRGIFSRYLELGCVRELSEELVARGVLSKTVTTKDGKVLGGKPLWTGPVRYILANRTYLGEIRHGASWHPGLHKAIVPAKLFDAVAADLAKRSRQPRRARACSKRPLLGLAFDDRGNPMTPSHTIQAQGRRYNYYVSHALIRGGAESGSRGRIGAEAFEAEVLAACVRVFEWPPDWALVRSLLKRVELGRGRTRIEATWRGDDEAGARARLRSGEALEIDGDLAILSTTSAARPWSGRPRTFAPKGALAGKRDVSMLTALAQAHAWRREWAGGRSSVSEIANRERVDAAHVFRMVRLAYLAPDLTRRILEDGECGGMSVTRLLALDLPGSWEEQRRLLLPDRSALHR